MHIKIGNKLPPFSVNATSNRVIAHSDINKSFTVIYFYPKDSTPGCTTEGRDFSNLQKQFDQFDTEILGVSLDSIKRHDNFKSKQNFTFDLISDPEAEFCNLFGVYQLKKNFGKEYMGIVRSTFLFDKKGVLVHQWPKVKVNGHAQEVLQTIQSMQ